MTIKSNGEAAECVEDFNNEIILGTLNLKPSMISGTARYHKLRQDHFNLTPGIKCSGQCDMKLLGSFVK